MRIISFLILLSISNSFAQNIRVAPGKPLIKTNFAYANGGETLREFLIEDIGFQEKELTPELYEKIKSYNPHIDETKLLSGQELYLEYPAKINLPLVPIKKKAPKKTIEPKTKIAQKTIKREKPVINKTKPQIKAKAITKQVYKTQVAEFPESKDKTGKSFRLSAFYMMSMGTFSETLTSGAELSTKQNSPISFGLAFGKKRSKETSLSGSVYFSTLTGTAATTAGASNESVDISPEIGTNIYYNKTVSKYVHSIYAGLDFEKFSTFNTDELDLGATLSTREHSIFYLTAGFNHLFTLFNMRNLFKFSVSKSLLTSSSRESLVSSEQFSGWRYTFYYNVSPGGKLFYHLLFKRHQMTGPTDLTINRIGLGLGYSIF